MAIGCYTEPYLPASFKLIPFKATEVTSEHGRRGAEGEFPFGENTAYADLGRKIRRYSISARFDTNLHVLQAAALIAVCEAPGPGVLTHPTRGVILSAACTSLRVRDNVEDEQGVTYVDMDFVEANNWPNGLSLVGQLIGLALGTIIGASRDHFSSRYAPATVQPFRQEAVVDAAQDQIGNIQQAYANATTGSEDQLSRNRIIYDLQTLRDDNAMAATTTTMDRGLALGMNAVALELSGRAQYRAFKDIANGAALQSTFLAPASEAENAIYSNVRVIAAAYMAEGALEEKTARTGEVFEQLDTIDALLAQEQAYAREICDNHLFTTISNFRTEVATQLYRKAYDAPGLVEYNFNGRVHPVVAAYSIFDDAKRHRDLEALNTVGAAGRIGPRVAASQGA